MLVQKSTKKLIFQNFSLEIKPKDCSGDKLNSSRQMKNFSYLLPLCLVYQINLLICEDKYLNQEQSLISPTKDILYPYFADDTPQKFPLHLTFLQAKYKHTKK